MINQQKGFSLIEVLLSLMLVATMALALVEQQQQTRSLLSLLSLRAAAGHFLDQVDETLIKTNHLPPPPEPYHFSLQQSPNGAVLKLNWFATLNSLTRAHVSLSAFK